MYHPKKPRVDDGSIALCALALLAKAHAGKEDRVLAQKLVDMSTANLAEAEAEVAEEIKGWEQNRTEFQYVNNGAPPAEKDFG